MQDRRNFLKKAILLSSSGIFPTIPSGFYSEFLHEQITSPSPEPNATPDNESYWSKIRKEYQLTDEIINLNNGGISPSPKVVFESAKNYATQINGAPSYYMWRIYVKQLDSIKEKLGNLAGVSKDEIAILRNATEALDTAIYGIDLSKGDEVILSNWDYPNMINSWYQRSKREGIVIKHAQLDTISENVEDIVARFEALITPKTKILHITHMFNWTGQILPAKELCALARKHNLISIVDGAHSFNHIQFNILDLDCDYFGASLHKWLGAPIGTGFLYVKKDNIPHTWSLSSQTEHQTDSIAKLENYGTYPMGNVLAISDAIDFMNLIGIEAKEARLRYLKNYWVNQVKDIKKVTIDTSLDPKFSCGMAGFRIEGKSPKDINYHLRHKHKIHLTQYDKNDVQGMRISPNIYTSLEDLNELVEGIKFLST